MNATKVIVLSICAVYFVLSISGCATTHPTTQIAPSQKPSATSPFEDGCPNNTGNGKGKHGYNCTGVGLISDESYCLRAGLPDTRHVRAVKTPAAMAITDLLPNGRGTFTKPQYIDDPSYACYERSHIGVIEAGDTFHMTQKDGKLLLQIYAKGNNSLTPKWELSLSPYTQGGKPWDESNALQPIFYFMGTDPKGSCDSTSPCSLDYFLMHADRNEGFIDSAIDAKAASIERFFYFEVYRSTGGKVGCNKQRPDQLDLTNRTLANFRLWPEAGGEDKFCPMPSRKSEQVKIKEATTGGGGHDYP